MFPFYPYETGVTQEYITACGANVARFGVSIVMICGFQKPLERGNNGIIYILH
jgi:hypothetical protein